MINIKHLNRYLCVLSHKPVDFAFVVATLAKRELNLLNDRFAEAEAIGSEVHTEFRTAVDNTAVSWSLALPATGKLANARMIRTSASPEPVFAFVFFIVLLHPSMSDKRSQANFQIFPFMRACSQS